MAFYQIGKLILKSLFSKPATYNYPAVPREWQERTRGQIGIETEKCILCGICQKKCPANAIKVNRAKAEWTLEKMSCVQCNHCVDVCPKKCLIMDPKYTEPGTSKAVLIVNPPDPKAKAAAAKAKPAAPKPDPAAKPAAAAKPADAPKPAEVVKPVEAETAKPVDVPVVPTPVVETAEAANAVPPVTEAAEAPKAEA